MAPVRPSGIIDRRMNGLPSTHEPPPPLQPPPPPHRRLEVLLAGAFLVLVLIEVVRCMPRPWPADRPAPEVVSGRGGPHSPHSASARPAPDAATARNTGRVLLGEPAPPQPDERGSSPPTLRPATRNAPRRDPGVPVGAPLPDGGATDPTPPVTAPLGPPALPDRGGGTSARIADPSETSPARPDGSLDLRLDLNRATVGDLVSLPGIGPKRAADIIAWRESDGPFRRVEDLRKVRGIGPVTLAGLRHLVVVRDAGNGPAATPDAPSGNGSASGKR